MAPHDTIPDGTSEPAPEPVPPPPVNEAPSATGLIVPDDDDSGSGDQA
jgi:hypothetical protein